MPGAGQPGCWAGPRLPSRASGGGRVSRPSQGGELICGGMWPWGHLLGPLVSSSVPGELWHEDERGLPGTVGTESTCRAAVGLNPQRQVTKGLWCLRLWLWFVS